MQYRPLTRNLSPLVTFIYQQVALPMRWKPPAFRQSVQALFRRDAPASTAWVRNPRLEDVRRSMLASLSGRTGSEVARMNMRLRYAGDIEALWYLRADLFETLARLSGEAHARHTMHDITQMFHGLLPLSLRTPQPVSQF